MDNIKIIIPEGVEVVSPRSLEKAILRLELLTKPLPKHTTIEIEKRWVYRFTLKDDEYHLDSEESYIEYQGQTKLFG